MLLCEMQSASSRIWTRVAVSISYDDNHYTTNTSKHIWRLKKSKYSRKRIEQLLMFLRPNNERGQSGMISNQKIFKEYFICHGAIGDIIPSSIYILSSSKCNKLKNVEIHRYRSVFRVKIIAVSCIMCPLHASNHSRCTHDDIKY